MLGCCAYIRSSVPFPLIFFFFWEVTISISDIASHTMVYLVLIYLFFLKKEPRILIPFQEQSLLSDSTELNSFRSWEHESSCVLCIPVDSVHTC